MQPGLPVFTTTVAVATGAPGATRQDSLDGIDTTPLTDGVFAWVQSGPAALTLFRLDTSSAAAPDGTTVVAPLTGPGRWLAFAGGASGSSMVQADGISTGAVQLASIDTTGIADGTFAWVRSVEDLFVLNRTSALTADGITVVTGAVGGGQWLRRNNGSQRWLQQADWFIDASAGDDENDGNTSGTALRTHAELERRWGPNALLRQTTTVNILTDLDATDDATPYIDVTLEDGDVNLFYVGTATTILSGTLTAATTADSSTNTAQSVTDAAVGDWDTAGPGGTSVIGFRMRLTANNARAFLAQRVSATEARTGIFETASRTPPQSISAFSPVGNEAYVVESLTNMRDAHFKVRRSPANLAAGNAFGLWVEDLIIDGTTLRFDGLSSSSGAALVANDIRCLVLDSLVGGTSGLLISGCGIKAQAGIPLIGVESSRGRTAFAACVFFEGVTIERGSTVLFLEPDNLFQGPGAATNPGLLLEELAHADLRGHVGAFDWDAPGVRLQGSIHTEQSGGWRIYGDGNDRGMQVDRGGRFIYDPNPPPITGSIDQFLIGGTVFTSADLPVIYSWGGLFDASPTNIQGERTQRGTATLVAGTATVGPGGGGERIELRSGMRIVVARNTPGGTPGDLSVPDASRVFGDPGTGQFVINSGSGTDTSTVDWAIVS